MPIAKILVVDDEPSIRFLLEKVLTHDGYRVTTVDSAEAALACVAAEEFDLALTDLKMKGMDGLELLAALRRKSPETTVIVLTAHASLETAVEALRWGAHDYLFKPCKTVEIRESVRRGLLKRQREVRQRELLAQLERSLATSLEDIRATVDRTDDTRSSALEATAVKPAVEQARFLQRGGLIVDLMRHVVTLDGHLLELSPTEFDLLTYLVSEAPRVVPAQELIREVQGYESEAWEARDTVRSHVYHIRQRARAAAGRADIIKTVRGVGYTIGIE